jgi:hypothetical protein
LLPFAQQTAQKIAPKSSQELLEVHRCGAQDGIERIARNALQAVARQPVFRLQMPDAGFIFADFALVLIAIARPLYADDPLGVDLVQALYALDSTTIDLCLSVSPGPSSANTKAL